MKNCCSKVDVMSNAILQQQSQGGHAKMWYLISIHTDLLERKLGGLDKWLKKENEWPSEEGFQHHPVIRSMPVQQGESFMDKMTMMCNEFMGEPSRMWQFHMLEICKVLACIDDNIGKWPYASTHWQQHPPATLEKSWGIIQWSNQEKQGAEDSNRGRHTQGLHICC